MFRKDFITSKVLLLLLSGILVFLLGIFGLLIANNIYLAAILLFFIATVFLFISAPQRTLFLFGCFLLFQPVVAGLLRLRIIQNLDEAVILILFGAMVIRKIVKREPFRRSPIDIPLLCFIVLGLSGAIVNKIVAFPVSLGGLLLAIKGFLIFYLFANTHFEEGHIRFFLKNFSIIGLLLGCYGLLGVVFPNIFLVKLGFMPDTGRFGIAAAQSLFGHPGAFAAFMAILSCYSLSASLIKFNKRYLTLAAFFIICIILSFRRTSLFGLILAFITVSFLKLPLDVKNRKIKRNIFVIIFCILLIFSGFVLTMYKDLYQTYILKGNTPRNMLFMTGMNIMKDYFPIGSGFGTFSSGINRMVYSPLFYKYGLSRIWGLSPDRPNFTNDTFWPHILAETGIFGLLSYLLIIIGLFRVCVKAITALDKPILKTLGLGAFMVLVLSLIESSKGTFYELSLWTYFYFGCVGGLWALSQGKLK